MPVLGQQPDADRQGIASGHQPITIVLDLMHPVRPGWRLLTRRWQAGFDEMGGHGHGYINSTAGSGYTGRGRLLLPHVPPPVSGHLDQDIRAPA